MIVSILLKEFFSKLSQNCLDSQQDLKNDTIFWYSASASEAPKQSAKNTLKRESGSISRVHTNRIDWAE